MVAFYGLFFAGQLGQRGVIGHCFFDANAVKLDFYNTVPRNRRYFQHLAAAKHLVVHKVPGCKVGGLFACGCGGRSGNATARMMATFGAKLGMRGARIPITTMARTGTP